ncbi:MAG: MarR family winged helix-turn-helix transcriptional regulator [Atopobiaceae bacterium]
MDVSATMDVADSSASAEAGDGKAESVCPSPSDAISSESSRSDSDAAGQRARARQLTVELSELMVSLFNAVDGLEEKMLRRRGGIAVSMSEARVIQIVGDGSFRQHGKVTISQIAEEAQIRVPSATAAVNRLVGRGLLQKHRDSEDSRCVNVTLQKKGEEIYRLHSIFHVRMAEALLEGMSCDDMQKLVQGVKRLDAFYRKEAEG